MEKEQTVPEGQRTPENSITETSAHSRGQLRQELRKMNYMQGKRALSPAHAQVLRKEDSKQGASLLWARDKQGNPLPPKPEDVRQGYVGDCYLLAVLAGLAKQQPKKITQMIQENADGSYTVSFAGIEVPIDPQNPVSTPPLKSVKVSPITETLSADLGKRGALWPVIIEKAYMQAKGEGEVKKGFPTVDEGGYPGIAGQEILGTKAETFNPGQMDSKLLMGKLKAALDNKHVVTAFGPQEEDVSEDFRKWAEEKKRQFVFGHAYTILEVKGQRIRLYNPWGEKHPNKDTGWVSVEDFKKFYIEVAIN